MRRLVTYLLVVLIVGVSAVVIALLMKLKEIRFDAPPPAAGAVAQTIPGLQPGERLIGAEANPDRITLLLEDVAGARRAIVLDGRSFQPLHAATDTRPATGKAGDADR